MSFFKSHRLMAILVMTMLALPVVAQQNVPLTLAAAEDLALAAEPGQLAMLARAEALQGRALAASDLPDPQLRVGLNNFPIESGGFSTEGMTNVGVGLRQVFPAGKTREFDSQRLNLLADGAMQNAAARQRDVLLATRRAWLEVYYWTEAYQLVEESRAFVEDMVAITQSLYAVGRKSQQDVLRAELELSHLDERLIGIQQQGASARAALGEWIGVDSLRAPADKLPNWQQLPAISDLSEGLSQHPSLVAAEAQIQASEAGVGLAEQRSKPQWAMDLGYSYREGNLASGEPRSDFVSIGFSVGLPFFSKRAVDGTLTAALGERSIARSEHERTRRALHSQLLAAHSHWSELTKRLSLYDDRILDKSREHAEAALLAYQSDRGDFADVMRGFIDDLDTRNSYLRLQVERAQAYAVLANLGGLSR
ncbi:MAG: TolC family protein [Woeseiaceae bacterium]